MTKSALKSWTVWFNLIILAGAPLLARLWPSLSRDICGNSELTLAVVTALNLLLRFKTKTGVRVRRDTRNLLAVFAVAFLVLLACAPPPIAELLKDGVTCDVEFEVPEEPVRREKVKLEAAFTNCR